MAGSGRTDEELAWQREPEVLFEARGIRGVVGLLCAAVTCTIGGAGMRFDSEVKGRRQTLEALGLQEGA